MAMQSQEIPVLDAEAARVRVDGDKVDLVLVERDGRITTVPLTMRPAAKATTQARAAA